MIPILFSTGRGHVHLFHRQQCLFRPEQKDRLLQVPGPGNIGRIIAVIARIRFSTRSGLFSLDELCDILHVEYGYRSLHNRPGNKRKRFKQNLEEQLSESILFRRAPDGRYILNSEKKILIKYKGASKSSWYQLPNKSYLENKKIFQDYCIGAMLSGNRFRANKNISKYCGLTVRRVQYATRRNHVTCLFRKQYNYIETLSGDYKTIEKARAELFNIHDITSPLLSKKYGPQWVLRLNAPNTYRSFVLSGVKGYTAQPTGSQGKKARAGSGP